MNISFSERRRKMDDYAIGQHLDRPDEDSLVVAEEARALIGRGASLSARRELIVSCANGRGKQVDSSADEGVSALVEEEAEVDSVAETRELIQRARRKSAASAEAAAKVDAALTTCSHPTHPGRLHCTV